MNAQLLSPPIGILAAYNYISEGTEERKRRDVLTRVKNTINQVRISSKASTIWYFLIVLFSIPPWSARTRSIAMTRSSGVRNAAFTGESGIHNRTAKPHKIAKAPVRR